MAGVSTVYPPEVWARESLILLQNMNVMANLVHRDFENEVASAGDVVNTRKPSKFTVGSLSNTVTAAMTVAKADATNVPITLDQHQYVAFAITSRDMATSIKNLIEEFMEPAMIPLATKIDADLLNKTNGLGAIAEVASDVTCASGVFEKVTLAGVQKKLLDNQVPFAPISGVSRISLVLNTQHHADLIVQPEVIAANTTGLNPPPIRTGFVASLFGMNVYVDQQVPTITTSTIGIQSVAFHKNAIALVTRPLESVGSEFGMRSAVVQKDGIGLRMGMSYSHLNQHWLVSMDILYGFKVLDGLLAVRITES